MKLVRIKCIDTSGNTSYIHQLKNGGWACTLANGTPASFSYAGIKPEQEMEFRFALEDIAEAGEGVKGALAWDAIRKFGSPIYKYLML